MNIQIKRFGKDVKGFHPCIPNRDMVKVEELSPVGLQISPEDGSTPLRVLVYFERGDEIPVSFIKSEQDLTDWVIEYQGQRYQCSHSKRSNSELFKTVIIPLNERDPAINLDAVVL